MSLSDELNNAAQKAAAKRIADLLTSPQYLTSVDQLKETTIKKKIALEVSLFWFINLIISRRRSKV